MQVWNRNILWSFVFNSNSITFWVCGSLQVPQPPWTETAMTFGRCSHLVWLKLVHKASLTTSVKQRQVLLQTESSQLPLSFKANCSSVSYESLAGIRPQFLVLRKCKAPLSSATMLQHWHLPAEQPGTFCLSISLCTELTQHQISLAKNKVLNCFPSQLVIAVCFIDLVRRLHKPCPSHLIWCFPSVQFHRRLPWQTVT